MILKSFLLGNLVSDLFYYSLHSKLMGGCGAIDRITIPQMPAGEGPRTFSFPTKSANSEYFNTKYTNYYESTRERHSDKSAREIF